MSDHPDGLACTAHPETSDEYASCLFDAERIGAIAGASTLGLATTGSIMLARSHRARSVRSESPGPRSAAWVVSTLLGASGPPGAADEES
ncbi:MAG: hypothetical protein GY929_01020 [Actinomycetia bacterium]|nr:hypothetical protein [Actinomycetes bacterium]